jgi:site-specific DNA-adenine methylase
VIRRCESHWRSIARYDDPATLLYLDPPYWDSEDDYGHGKFTYNRYVERFDNYEAILDYGCAALLAKLERKYSV